MVTRHDLDAHKAEVAVGAATTGAAGAPRPRRAGAARQRGLQHAGGTRERRRALAQALAKNADRLFRCEEESESDGDDSQQYSDDSCACAEAGWTEWSWHMYT